MTLLAKAHESILEEHRRLEDLVARLRAAEDLPTLVDLLDQLDRTLVAHFAHEEQPEGLYELLGVRAPEFKTPIGNLVDEHYQLLARARDLTERGRKLLEQSHLDLRTEARRLADDLLSHEQREQDVERRVLADLEVGVPW